MGIQTIDDVTTPIVPAVLFGTVAGGFMGAGALATGTNEVIKSAAFGKLPRKAKYAAVAAGAAAGAIGMLGFAASSRQVTNYLNKQGMSPDTAAMAGVAGLAIGGTALLSALPRSAGRTAVSKAGLVALGLPVVVASYLAITSALQTTSNAITGDDTRAITVASTGVGAVAAVVGGFTVRSAMRPKTQAALSTAGVARRLANGFKSMAGVGLLFGGGALVLVGAAVGVMNLLGNVDTDDLAKRTVDLARTIDDAKNNAEDLLER
uniref:Uncharacterized protein n=1 Tax=uncultured bacterium W5-102b TaxID=1130996 RepID=H9BWK9_9BACT|nr:hypothetical protein [uncultured bacterium W5-102b]